MSGDSDSGDPQCGRGGSSAERSYARLNGVVKEKLREVTGAECNDACSTCPIETADGGVILRSCGNRTPQRVVADRCRCRNLFFTSLPGGKSFYLNMRFRHLNLSSTTFWGVLLPQLR